jgi:hypothetical protein
MVSRVRIAPMIKRVKLQFTVAFGSACQALTFPRRSGFIAGPNVAAGGEEAQGFDFLFDGGHKFLL